MRGTVVGLLIGVVIGLLLGVVYWTILRPLAASPAPEDRAIVEGVDEREPPCKPTPVSQIVHCNMEYEARKRWCEGTYKRLPRERAGCIAQAAQAREWCIESIEPCT